MDSTQGATNNQRLMAAAREDNEDMLLEIFKEKNFDINFKDGLGNTGQSSICIISLADANVDVAGIPVRFSQRSTMREASHGSLEVIEHILSHEECDVDPINRLEGATPLHLAVVVEDPEVRVGVVASLLEAGADTRIRNKHGGMASDLVHASDTQVRALFRQTEVYASLSRDDVANDDEGGSGSGSDE